MKILILPDIYSIKEYDEYCRLHNCSVIGKFRDHVVVINKEEPYRVK